MAQLNQWADDDLGEENYDDALEGEIKMTPVSQQGQKNSSHVDDGAFRLSDDKKTKSLKERDGRDCLKLFGVSCIIC
eukprot:CAMPEP_0117753658 /NCGR_PEP_ID=MMETSP0947-20121206/12366_1 /TAXON_ID=44440 /ORGANISM="Chattonella subsalsa, Strain CCMP2191" /LENGTH=76 /DNA_ID=CAMNT_0005572601 /DNA_START=86 /DNA_END=316 /DNA_ORIENTATION=-